MNKVLQINYPMCIIEGVENPVHVFDIEGSPRPGSMLQPINEPGKQKWKVAVNNVDQDCVGGSCPVK